MCGLGIGIRGSLGALVFDDLSVPNRRNKLKMKGRNLTHIIVTLDPSNDSELRCSAKYRVSVVTSVLNEHTRGDPVARAFPVPVRSDIPGKSLQGESPATLFYSKVETPQPPTRTPKNPKS